MQNNNDQNNPDLKQGRRTGHRTSRRNRRPQAEVEKKPTLPPVWPGIPGGKYKPIEENDLPKFHQAVLTILEKTGLSHATPSLIKTVTTAGGTFSDDERLRFPASLVEDALAGYEKGFILAGQSPKHDMSLSGSNVHMGSGAQRLVLLTWIPAITGLYIKGFI